MVKECVCAPKSQYVTIGINYAIPSETLNGTVFVSLCFLFKQYTISTSYIEKKQM